MISGLQGAHQTWRVTDLGKRLVRAAVAHAYVWMAVVIYR